MPATNALSTISYLIANYYCFCRSHIQFYYWILYELLFILLWLNSFISGNNDSIIFLVGSIGELILNVLSIKKWKMLHKKQKEAPNF